LTQISEIKIADIPDVDLSNVGVTNFGSFSVEVIDPVSDYLELLEVNIISLLYYNPLE
jgi:phosphoglucomutase